MPFVFRSPLRYVFPSSLVFLAALSAPAHAQSIQWAQQFGTNRVEEAFAVAAAAGSVYVAGETFGAFPDATNAGNRDAFVKKFDTQGNAQWTRQLGTTGDDIATGLAADDSGVYVVGHTMGALQGANAGSNDVFVRKYDGAGNEVWTRQFGTDVPDAALAAALDETGLYVAGRTAGALPGQTSGSLGQDDAFVRKYDFNGNELWTRQFGTSSGDRAHGVAAAGGGVYLTGSTGGNLAAPAAGTDGFVRMYDADGNVGWTNQIASTGTGNDTAYAVAVNDSGVYVCGDTTGVFEGQTRAGGLYDAWVRAFGLDGAVQWTSQFGTTGDDYAYGAGAAPQWVYVGAFYGTQNAILKRYELGGVEQGAVELVSASDREFAYAVAVDGSAAYLAGSKDGSSLGQTPQGDLDALVLKVPHPPEISGISDAFTGQPGVAPTTWIALYGSNLSATTRTWDGAIQGTQLPTSLDEVTVRINGRPATMYFISPGQVNVIGPIDETAGEIQVTLTNAYGTSAPFPVTKTQVLPAFYAPFGEAKGLFVTAVALDGTLVGKPALDPRVPRPARPGEIIQFFATGFGVTNPAVPTDQIFIGAPEVANPPRITIGGREAALTGTGYLVGPGLYQFNLTIPDVPDGEHVIQASVGGASSLDSVFLSVGR